MLKGGKLFEPAVIFSGISNLGCFLIASRRFNGWRVPGQGHQG